MGEDLITAASALNQILFHVGGVSGPAVAGIVMSAVWFPIAYRLGRRYEGVRSGEVVGGAPVAVPAK